MRPRHHGIVNDALFVRARRGCGTTGSLLLRIYYCNDRPLNIDGVIHVKIYLTSKKDMQSHACKPAANNINIKSEDSLFKLLHVASSHRSRVANSSVTSSRDSCRSTSINLGTVRRHLNQEYARWSFVRDPVNRLVTNEEARTNT